MHAVPGVHRPDLHVTGRILAGKGVPQDPDTIVDVAKRGVGSTICAFYDGAIGPYISYVEKFRAEFDHHVRHGACDVRPGAVARARGRTEAGMPKLTVDGQQVEVPAGTNLIETARRLGIEVPHYCYHPGLPIAGRRAACAWSISRRRRARRSPATRRRPTAWW